MNIKRILKHLSSGHVAMRRIFPRATLKRIEHTIAEVEQTHAGQIRFVVEDALDLKPLLAGQSARDVEEILRQAKCRELGVKRRSDATCPLAARAR